MITHKLINPNYTLKPFELTGDGRVLVQLTKAGAEALAAINSRRRLPPGAVCGCRLPRLPGLVRLILGVKTYLNVWSRTATGVVQN